MKRLFRSRKEKLIGGVCGGLANYFAIDPVIVRIFFVILFFLKGIGLISYIVCWIVMPEERHTADYNTDAEDSTSSYDRQKSGSHQGALVTGIILVALGTLFLLNSLNLIDNIMWWLTDTLSTFLIPLLVIGAGLALILRNRRPSDDVYSYSEETESNQDVSEEPEHYDSSEEKI